MKVLSLVFALLAGAALAAPETVKRPVGRPGSTAGGTHPLVLDGSGAIATPQRDPAAQAATRRGTAPTTSLRPQKRTRAVMRSARKHRKLREKGAVCGDTDIQGEIVGRVAGRISGCGLAEAVRVRSVSDVTLSQRSVMDCDTARALKSWVDQSVKPALRKQGGGVKGLRVAAHYACRTRNNKKGARISEHGKGRAIDISGFQLRDGTRITVLRGWTARATAQAMRDMHRGACGPFGTVLGPNADSFHRDHFHFDTARYRSGTYCR
ncbi:extensin family protein [Roseobacter sp. YSTF-M11]|uniref:Extensin family protein n=1 Tax=Roseobacter insulae TaxID=2859783 RepID=A0A9X1FZI1_9RHOB|nr:extensin family protein [Roseobacter insulae]MBW4710589.1 extensin family protein [Roseobacter insulae]